MTTNPSGGSEPQTKLEIQVTVAEHYSKHAPAAPLIKSDLAGATFSHTLSGSALSPSPKRRASFNIQKKIEIDLNNCFLLSGRTGTLLLAL